MKNKLCIFLATSLITASALASQPEINLGYAWTNEGKVVVSKLKEAGYHDAIVLYNQPLRCHGKLDSNSGGFRAISKDNNIVEGVVCGDGVYIKKTTITEK